MPFQPAIDEQFVIDGINYQVCAHPAIPGQAFVQEGQSGRVVQLRAASGFVALKVQTQIQDQALIEHARQLHGLSAIPGLQAARRIIITAATQPALVSQYPDLNYAILMPWVYGPTWQELIRHRRPLSPAQSLTLARALANLLTEIEQRGLVHGDLQAAHVMLPGLIDPGAAAPVALVDLETIHGVGVRRLPLALPTSPYQHPVATQGLALDRFGGALLLLELLGWCDEQVRAAAATDSFFATTDLLQPTERFQTLRAALAQRWGVGIVQMLDRLWQSATPMNCPQLKEWQAILPPLSMATSEPLATAAPALAPIDIAAQLIDNAAELRKQGQAAQALHEYQNALDQLPATDPRVSEIMQTINTLKRELDQSSTDATPPASANWLAPMIIGMVTIVLLIVLAAIGLNQAAPTTLTATATTAPTMAAAVVTSSPLLPSPTVAPRQSPTSVVTFKVERIIPTELFTGAPPLEFTVQGAGLDTVRVVTLRAAGYEPIPVTIVGDRNATTLRLRIDDASISLIGAVPFTLEFNGIPVPGAAITLRDFSSARVVTGVRPEYQYTGRIENEGSGVFTRMYADPSPGSSLTVPIRNGDEVEILAEQPPGWYWLRIRTSADQNLIGRSGYLERWLVDNTDVPPPPTPTPLSEPPRLRFIKLNESEDPRCVLIQIRGINTKGWIVSIDGLRLSNTFDASGDARICGLRPRQEVTFTVRDELGAPVRGGVGIPTRGNDVMFAEWR